MKTILTNRPELYVGKALTYELDQYEFFAAIENAADEGKLVSNIENKNVLYFVNTMTRQRVQIDQLTGQRWTPADMDDIYTILTHLTPYRYFLTNCY